MSEQQKWVASLTDKELAAVLETWQGIADPPHLRIALAEAALRIRRYSE